MMKKKNTKTEPLMEVRDEELVIRVNSNLYPKEAVLEAIEDYTKVCWINIREKGEEYILTLEPRDEAKELDFKEIGGSFMNYVLGKVKNK